MKGKKNYIRVLEERLKEIERRTAFSSRRQINVDTLLKKNLDSEFQKALKGLENIFDF